jgi:hypothetical protein
VAHASSVLTIGSLSGGGWIGLARQADGYRLAVGAGGADRAVKIVPADVADLLALAIAYFEEALDEPAAEMSATQQDLAELVRWLRDRAPDPAGRRRLQEALDAIDDGMAGDVVAGLLSVARAPAKDEQADPVDLLVTRARSLLGESA